MRTLPGVAARRFPIGMADAKFGLPHRYGDSTNGRKWAIIIFNGNFSFHITLSPCFSFTGLPSCRCETGLAKKSTKTVRGPDWLCSKAKKKKDSKISRATPSVTRHKSRDQKTTMQFKWLNDFSNCPRTFLSCFAVLVQTLPWTHFSFVTGLGSGLRSGCARKWQKEWDHIFISST